MSGPVYGRTCEGCEHVIAEKWVKGKTAHRCNAPGPCRGYVVGQEYLSKDDSGKIQRGTWHTVEVLPDTMSRIVGAVFSQTFCNSRGGGDY